MVMRLFAMRGGIVKRSALNPEEQGGEENFHRQGREQPAHDVTR